MMLTQKRKLNTINIPFYGKPSLILKKKLKSVLDKFNSEIGYCFSVRKLSTYFIIKDFTPKFLMSKVVYKFQCPFDEDQSYIGKTKRHLNLRVKEHLSMMGSSVHQHITNCNCSPTIKNFVILDKAVGEFELNIKEALFIKYHDPKLNVKLANSGSSYYLKIFS